MKSTLVAHAFSVTNNKAWWTHDALVGVVPAAVGCGQRGGALLSVPGGQALLGGAADRDGVDAIGVAVTVTVISLPTSVARCPHEDGALPPAALSSREEGGRRGEGGREEGGRGKGGGRGRESEGEFNKCFGRNDYIHYIILIIIRKI